MTERRDDIAAFQILWPITDPHGVKLRELSEYLSLNIKDPAKFGVDVLGWVE